MKWKPIFPDLQKKNIQKVQISIAIRLFPRKTNFPVLNPVKIKLTRVAAAQGCESIAARALRATKINRCHVFST